MCYATLNRVKNIATVAGLLLIGTPYAAFPAETPGPTIVKVNDYGAKPDSGEDASGPVQRAIAVAARLKGPVVIRFTQGRYDLYSKGALKRVYYISNTASEKEVPDPIKTIAFWLQGMRNVVIDGQGSAFILHGKMTGFVIDQCSNVELRNLHFDMLDPTVAELCVVAQQGTSLIMEPLAGSHYRLTDGKVSFWGEGWKSGGQLTQAFDPEKGMTWRCQNPFVGAEVREIRPGRLELTYKAPPGIRLGWHYQFRDGIRDQAAGLIQKSKDVRISSVTMNFMHGFGIVAQSSENVTFDRLVCEPTSGSGRTCAAFADMLQVSGCKGKIVVSNSRFSGAQDDLINIHGTHLKIVEQRGSRTIVVRFMHPQTYGLEAFFAGDELNFVDRESLLARGTAFVVKVRYQSLREILLTLDRDIPTNVDVGKDVVENTTWTPDVEISHSYFSRTPTRAILVTTRRKVLITDNVFFRTNYSAILIADDAKSWFESGPVCDMTISQNQFIECGCPVISITPEGNAAGDDYFVHQNVRVQDNMFKLAGSLALSARATKDLRFVSNTIVANGAPPPFVSLSQCPGAFIEGVKPVTIAPAGAN